MYHLEVLLIMFLVIMTTTTIEGRSILYKTAGETIPRRLSARRLIKYKEDMRGNQMLRPSTYRSMVLNPNLQFSERLPRRPRRLPQHSKPFGYQPLDTLVRGDSNRNTFSRENSILFHARPIVKHLDQLQQRNRQAVAHRYDKFLAPSTGTASVKRRKNLAKKHSLVNANLGATRTIPVKRNPTHKLSVNFDINRSRDDTPKIISVKAKNIRNIQLSRLINKAIINMQKGGKRTRIIFSRNTHRPSVKAEKDVGVHASENTKFVSLEQSKKQSQINKAILNKHNDQIIHLTPTTPSSVETATITEILGRQNSTNMATHQPTTYIGNKTQTSTVTSDITMTTVAGRLLSPKNSNQSTTSSFTTSMPANDVTTEEPDTPDVDVESYAFRNPFYSALDYD